MAKKEKTLDQRIEDLRKAQEEAKSLFLKYQGAIEVLELMKSEKNEKRN